PDRDRHVGDRWHAHRDRACHLLHSALLRARAAHRARWPEETAREVRRPAGGSGVKRTAVMIALLATGCSMEPRLGRPDPAIPPSWPVGAPYLAQSEAALPAVTYQQIFTDPRLQTLIGQALINNR